MPTGSVHNAAIQLQMGQWIRQLRVERRWSQETLAEKADLDVTFLSGVERGKRNISLFKLWRIANAFNLSLSELCDLPKGRETGKRTMEAHIIFLLRKQKPKTMRFILTYIESLDQFLSGGVE